MDSGAFTTLSKYGRYPHAVSEYVSQIRKFRENGNLLAAVAQDYMCEPEMLERTGLMVADHQRLTLERYDALMELADSLDVYVMPVLQGYAPAEYVAHLRRYGKRLARGAWVGVGSVCKRSSNVSTIEDVLGAIKAARPDLQLHGFGLKGSSFKSPAVIRCLHSADSMAWSFAARFLNPGRQNSWREAKRWVDSLGLGN